MIWDPPSRWLPVLLLGAGLQAATQAPPAQGRSYAPASSSIQPVTQTPATSPAPSVQQAPATSPPSVNPKSAPSSAAVAQTAAQKEVTPEQLGDSLQARGRYQAALEAYAKVKEPSASLWNKMGIAHQMLFNQRDANRCYRESLKLDPRNPLVLNNMGTLLDSQKQFRAAEKMYRKALKIDPQSAMVLKNLGTNLLVQHKYDKGWEAYKKAMTIDPQIFEDRNSPRVQNPTTVQDRGAMNYYMARGCLHMGQTECALQYLRMAVNEGFTTPKKLASDEDFAALRDNPAFKQMLAELDQEKKQQRQ